jgi:hypothetical protein
VVVALVVVEFIPVKFWRVEDADTRRLPPRVSCPLAFIDRAAVDEVANVEALEVAIYRRPPAFLKDQWLRVLEELSERVS